MNSFGYLFHQFAARFGLVSTRSYLRNATEEAVLLAEAQVLLGKLAWKDLEDVDDISTEYWNLRELQREQDSTQTKLSDFTKSQNALMEEPNEAPDVLTNESFQLEESIRENRSTYLDSLAEIQQEIGKSNKLYKRFNGLKLKLNVLKNEGADEADLAKIRDQLRETRDEYSSLSRVIAKKKEAASVIEEQGNELQDKAAKNREQITDHHRRRTRNIAENSKTIVEFSARIEQIEKKKRELQKDIGKFLCHNCGKQEDLAAVTKKFSPLLGRIRSLMESIRLNYRLAEFR